jgi:hypothetical protein
MRATSVFDENIMWRSLLHVAMCDETLNDPASAAACYRDILEEHRVASGNVPADVLQAAQTALERLDAVGAESR